MMKFGVSHAKLLSFQTGFIMLKHKSFFFLGHPVYMIDIVTLIYCFHSFSSDYFNILTIILYFPVFILNIINMLLYVPMPLEGEELIKTLNLNISIF